MMMMIMDEDHESRFVCKLCNKKYPCGKSLGGHMRSHVVAESEEKGEINMKKISSLGDFGHQSMVKDSKFAEFGNGQQSSYVLRENPKKTWRASDARTPLQQEQVCKQCGKAFLSLKALCGHMACHSEKDKGLKDDHSWTSEYRKLVLDSFSDTEEADEQKLRTRSSSSSKCKRYKKVVVKSPSMSAANNNNVSSSVSEIDGQDQEEVAMCLMMLSRDSGTKGGVNSVVESSDNNSVVLETKSSSTDMRVGEKDKGKPKIKKIEDVKLIGVVMDDEVDAQAESSDSGYFLDECAKAESHASFNVSRRNGLFGERSKNFRKFTTEEFDEDFLESRKRELWIGGEVCDNNSQKRSKYECFNCKKTFKSYQALGGHRPCYKRSESRYGSGENSLDNYPNGKLVEHTGNRKSDKKVKPKKNKGHVCPFCSRVFKNGQALGGHKRSHFIGGGHGEVSNQRQVIKPEVDDLLDLNLPAPEADEDDEHGQFNSW